MKIKWKAVAVIAAVALSICTLEFSTATGENSSVKSQKVITLYVGSPTALVNNEETRIDKDNPDVVPLVENDRTLVPVRFISEKLGLEVLWNNETSSVDIKNGEAEISLVLGSNVMKVGKRQVNLDTEAKSINGRTFIPLRAMVEAMGRKVFYDRGLIVISNDENIYDASKDKEKLDGIIASINRPPVVGSEDAFKALIKSSQIENGIFRRGNVDVKEDAAFTSGMPAPEMKNEAAKQKSVSHNDYSKTNVQVEGVDESDVVKTDGEYIYQVNNGRIVIAKAYPAQDLEVASIVSFDGKNFSPSEIYVDEKHLTVIGNTTGEINFNNSITTKDELKCPPPVSFGATRAIVYDISDKKNVKELRQFEIEGNCVSTRKIGSALYLVTVKNIPYQVRYMLDDSSLKKQYEKEYKDYGEGVAKKVIDAAVGVSYRDSGSSDSFQQIGYDRMYYFPDAVYQNYMNVAVLDLDDPGRKASVATYLGAGNNIYASEQNLYIAVNGSRSYNPVAKMKALPSYGAEKTLLYKFSLTKDAVTYLCKGEVPGTILNQYSMDENGRNFRIATTSYSSGDHIMQNNVYVTDELLNVTGRLENMAPGERIYSVRFMGERAYVVTFRNVDPLFVIEQKGSSNPKVLGSLKIPGYSNYLHPYDDKHIIGFGKDTVEGKGGTAYYLGLKMAIFDVSDVEKPVEMFTEKIGDRGTDSEVLNNPKALLFSKEKNLLALPVTLMEIKDGEKMKSESPEYGRFSFQGAYVYNIDLLSGFKLKGRITHLGKDDIEKAGDYWYQSPLNIDRILYIDDMLYTLSQRYIKANDISNLTEKKALQIP